MSGTCPQVHTTGGHTYPAPRFTVRLLPTPRCSIPWAPFTRQAGVAAFLQVIGLSTIPGELPRVIRISHGGTSKGLGQRHGKNPVYYLENVTEP